MTDYKAEHQESSSKTQRAAILRVLGRAGEKWVPLPQILELRISQYGARIYELRRLGHRIENKSEWRNGKRLSWFRLIDTLPVNRLTTGQVPHGTDPFAEVD